MDESELLFFDTFSHDSAEELNLDLVQFPHAVLINEVRVIPLGTRVQADVPGGVRLGATNPSTFKLEFFSNNLSKRDASTFQKLGLLEYKANVDIQFLPENKNPTDGLILKGWYTTITLAVYGVTTVVSRDKSPPPPPPPQPRAKPVVDAVPLSSTALKASSSLTPSDLPSLPSSKKVHKWLVDSSRPTGSHAGGAGDHTHGQTQHAAATAQWEGGSPGVREESALPPTAPANQVVSVPVSSLGQADLAREIIQVLGNVAAAHTADQTKGGHAPAPVTSSTGHYTQGQDTPASPGLPPPSSYQTRPSVVAAGIEQTVTPDFSSHVIASDPLTSGAWLPQTQEFAAVSGEQQPIPIVGSVPGPAAHAPVATETDEALLEPGYQAQDSRSPRDIPLEGQKNVGGPMDPRLDPREVIRDPREPRDSLQPSDSLGQGRQTPRSRSRSRERDTDRMDQSEWPAWDKAPRDVSDRQHTRESDWDGREHGRDPERELDRDRKAVHDSERERLRELAEPRDSDRDRDREHSKKEDNWGKDIEQGRDRPMDYDYGHDAGWSETEKDHKRMTRDPLNDVGRESMCESHLDRDQQWDQDQNPRGRDKPVTSQLEQVRMSEPIPVIMSPAPVATRSPSPDSSIHYQQVDVVGMSPDPNGPELAQDPDMDNPEGVDIYGSLAMDNINENLSDGEIQEGEGYSDISSDDNILTHLEEVDKIGDWGDYEIDDAWNFTISAFNPYQCYLGTLETFSDPALTAYEVQKQKMVLCRSAVSEGTMPVEALQILDIVKQYQTAPHHESWIKAAEEIPTLLANGLSYLVNKTDNKVLDTLLDWAFEGLDLTTAIAQPETAYKVRHLKMGIRLSAALCGCDSYITFRMLSGEVQHKLLDLFVSPHMASSIKLQIVKALDMSTRLKDGMDWLLGKHHLQQHTQTSSAYQRLLEVMLNKQVVRVSVAMASLARKVHVYEVLGKLNNTVKMIADSTPEPKPGMAVEEVEAAAPEDIDDQPLGMEPISDDDAEIVVSCLEETTKVLRNAENMLAQAKRGLPNEVVFTKPEKHDASANIYHMFNSCHILESVFVLLSSPATCTHSRIFYAVRGLLLQLVSTQSGLIYLSAHAEDVINGVIRCLLQNPTSSGEYTQEEDRESHPGHQLGLSMVYSLQAVQHIDQLRLYHTRDKTQKDVDDAEALGALHALYTMMFSPQGRDAVVYVLGLEDNMKIFMPFLDTAVSEGAKDTRRKSVCYSYTILFLLTMLRYSDQVPWMQKLGQKIVDCCENVDVGSSKMAEKLAEIQERLTPCLKCKDISPDNIPHLVSLLKTYNDDILDLPKGLVTVLRFLNHLATSPQHDPTCQENVSVLRYKYVILELFSADTLPIFCNILQKVADLVLRPWQQGVPQNSASRTLLLSIVRPTLAIMKSILGELIQTRGAKFSDLSCLPCLLHLHTVLCSWSHTGTLTNDLQQLQDDIVNIILCYTQPTVAGQDSDQALSQSLWTLTMKEIFKYVLTAPYTFLGGLILVSELLPLPLPIQTKEALTPEEVETATNNRKLWSAHLHPVSAEIQEVIHCLAVSVCHPLQQVLRRVCWQLADLAVPSATLVVRCVVDAALESLGPAREGEAAPGSEEAGESPSSADTARVLSLLSFLMNQASFKASFLALTRPGPKVESKYADILSRLINLLNVVSESPVHTLAQEHTVSILQSLCDCDISLMAAENMADQLRSGLPGPDQLSLICMGLVTHISNQDHKFSSILPSLRNLSMLMDHDYGFYHVKRAMEQVGTTFFNLFNQINITFSKDSSDCLATLSSAAECIQFLVTLPDGPTDGNDIAPLERSYTMTLREVRELLGWSDAHPLEDLNALLCEYAKEEETLRAVYESVNGVVSMLKSEEEDGQHHRPEVVQPQIASPEPLINQFGQRAVFALTDEDDERLSATYWLATPMMIDDPEQLEPDLIVCDADEMSMQYCPDFDLKIELEKGSLPSDITATKPRRRRRGNDTINTSRMRGSGSSFVAPMRGRGFGRGIGMNMNKNDAFRSRAPNTSRPPSMHVDDFVKFENSQNSSGQQAVSNLRTPRQDKESVTGARGRGFDRGRGANRGFFHGNFQRSGGLQSGNYNRRDQNQRGGFNNFRGMAAGNRGGSAPRGLVRGSATSRGGVGGRVSPVKGLSAWRNSRQQGYGSRAFGRGDGRLGSADRMGSVDRMDRRRDNAGGGGGMRFQRSGRPVGTSPWESKHKAERFMPLGGFHRRDRGRHQRAFTK